MAWQIEFSVKAEKDFAQLGKPAQKIIWDYLHNRLLLSDNPKTFGKPLRHEFLGLWRYRVDKYRIICKIEENKLIITVIRVGKRDKIYET